MLCVSGALPVALASLLGNFDRVAGGVGLHLSGNPWEHPPEAIVKGGMVAVRGYFEAMFRGGATTVTRPLKVVIVGKETVGKTRYEGTPLVLKFSSYVSIMFSEVCFLAPTNFADRQVAGAYPHVVFC